MKTYIIKEEKDLEKFKDNFDVIILNDGPMKFIKELVNEIIRL